jgi:hypothetical protein
LSDYSIADFLKALANDNIEQKMIKLISEGYTDEALLTKLLDIIGEEKNVNL